MALVIMMSMIIMILIQNDYDDDDNECDNHDDNDAVDNYENYEHNDNYDKGDDNDNAVAGGSVAVISQTSPTTAIVKYAPTLDQQTTDRESGLSGRFVVRYDVNRSMDAGDVMVGIMLLFT